MVGGGGGGGGYDPRAVDVWAMGVMLYLMVAGVYPFEDPDKPDNVASTLQNVRDGRIRPLPAGVSHACADLIAKMLHKKAAKRVTLVSPSLLPFLPFLPFLLFLPFLPSFPSFPSFLSFLSFSSFPSFPLSSAPILLISN